ncbi:MAG: precorrin-4 C(11)-methyltransferase [Deltaproteobacteria bacterium]|nr:MAG: precorrin-4 C(11)-methyltransferase [Deltaproteobacteria bacterium]
MEVIKLKAIEKGKVYFVGAGPGDPELITVFGARVVEAADLIVYAGSLVPRTLLDRARKEAEIHDSSGLSLEETHALLTGGVRKGLVVARVHTGDPTLYGAIQEQIELLQKEGIPFEVVPGVTVAFAAAAALGRQLTQPGGSQTVILTRLAGKTPVPESENLAELSRHHASLVIYLSVSRIREVVAELEQGYAADTPVVVAYRVGWPDERFISASLADIANKVEESGIKRQAVIMVGKALAGGLEARSKLYDPSFTHGFRKGQVESKPHGVAVMALTPEGSELAANIAQNLEKSSLYLPEKSADRSTSLHTFTDFRDTFSRCFNQHKEMVCVMATGIVVRLLAALLRGKDSDPAVVVVDEMGRNAVSLVSGHLGGANALARRVAAITGGQAVITTATDVQGKVSFDELAMHGGLVIENLERVKTLNMALLEGQEIGLFDPGRWLHHLVPESVRLRPLKEPEEARDVGVSCWIFVGEGFASFEPPPCLILRPKNLVVGVGCNRGTHSSEIGAAVERVFRGHGLSLMAIRNLATAELKRDEEGLNELLAERGWSAEYFAVPELEAGGPVPRPSEVVKKHLGVESVCEKAAMLSAGTEDLLVAKEILGNVTVAVARVISS